MADEHPIDEINDHIEQLQNVVSAIESIIEIHVDARDKYLSDVDDDTATYETDAKVEAMNDYIRERINELPDEEQEAMDRFDL